MIELLLMLILIYLCKPFGRIVGAALEWAIVVAVDLVRLLWVVLCWLAAVLAVVCLGALVL